jgi:hypothetical protein
MRKKILITLGLTSVALMACVSTPVQNPQPEPKAVFALKSCPSCVADLKASPGTRLLDLKVNSNDPNLEIKYSFKGDQTKNLKSHNVVLGTGSFDGIVQIPENTEIVIGANYDYNKYTLKGYRKVTPQEQKVVVNLNTVLTLDLLTQEFNKLSKDQKKKLIEVVGLYDIALNSPRMLFSSKLSEAEKEANSFYIDMPKNFKETELSNKLEFLMWQMDFIRKQENTMGKVVTGIDTSTSYIDIFKKVFNN